MDHLVPGSLLSGIHSTPLVAVAFGVMAAALYLAQSHLDRFRRWTGPGGSVWLAASILTFGFGAWAKHFLLLVSFQLPVPVRYDYAFVLLSLLLALITAVPAVLVWNHPRIGGFQLIGIAIAMAGGYAGVQYAGLLAMRMPAGLELDGPRFLLNLAAALVGAGACFAVIRHVSSRRGQVTFAVAFSAMLVSLHYLGIRAVRFVYTGELGSRPGWVEMDTRWHVLLVVVFTLLSLGLPLLAAMVDDLMQGRLNALNHQYELILTSAAEGIYGLDLEGRCTCINPAAARMLGYEPRDLMNRPMHTIIHHTTPAGAPYPEGDCPIYASLRSGVQHREEEDVFWRQDGTSFPVSYVSAPIRQEGRIIGTAVLFRDISDRQRSELAMRERHIAEERDRVRSQLVQITAHELRNPMAGIKGIAALLRRRMAAGVAPGDLNAFLSVLEQEIDRLSGLTSDMLDAFLIREGRIQLKSEPVDLREVIAAALQPFQVASSLHAFAFTHPTTESAVVLGDRVRLEEVVRNLLTNAVKYSPDGGEILVILAVSDQHARISVRDQGVGIPVDQIELVFTAFFRGASAATARDPGGLGLGLFICRDLIDRHGGRIWAESEPGAGAVLHVELPLAQAAPHGEPE